MIIGIDFDGTFTMRNEYPSVGEVNEKSVEVIHNMISRGHKIVLNTMRSGIKLNDAVKCIEGYEIHLYGINKTPGQNRWTDSSKVYAHVYIDDLAIGIPKLPSGILDWEKIEQYLINAGF